MLDMFRQFIVFCGVGLVNTAAGLSIILLLSEKFGIHYMLANACGYAAGLTIAFILHKKITFKLTTKAQDTQNELIKFISVFIICYLSQLVSLYIMVAHIGIYQALAQIVALGIYTVLNYLGHRYFTFNNKETEQ